MAAEFFPLHLHTQYSLLEGAIRIKALPQALQEQGYAGCAITDLGNLFGAIEFYEALKKAGLRPLIGMEAFVADGGRRRRDYSRLGPNAGQLVLLCQNREGYRNLCHLASLAFLEGKYYQPRIDRELLERHHQGLIALSGGEWGVLARTLRLQGPEQARAEARWLGQVFDGRFYVEMQNQGLPWEQEGNPQLLSLAAELELPLAGTNECFYLHPQEGEAQYLLRLIGRQKTIQSPGVEPYRDLNRHLRSAEEMREVLAGFPAEAYANPGRIAEQCELDLSCNTYHLPQCETPPGRSEEEHLRAEAAAGLERRLELLHARYCWNETEAAEQHARYSGRLEFELGVITSMKYSGYFLIVADFINWAKEQGVRVGPGRGSGAGSLVAYALRITDLDPLYHGLLFERFLNPERVSMPDFDIDFDVDGRDKVIGYVREKYGQGRVCQISTFGSLGAKGALRNVARVLGFSYGDADRIAKLIPNKLGVTLEEAAKMEPQLAQLETQGSEEEKRLLQVARTLEGLSSNLSTHAAGVIILNQDVQDVMPVCISSKSRRGEIQSQYAMKWAEHQGAVKFDFLGLNNLTIIQQAVELIGREAGESAVPLDIDALPLDDPKVYALLSRADTTGVFQLESSGMRRLLLDLQPNRFEDLVAILALYRPGPLDSGMTQDFIKRKNGRAEVVPLHPDMEPVLRETYGVMAYQEQVMQAARVLAGFSLGEADVLRRAMGKKDPQEMARQRQRFVEGCQEKQIAVRQAEDIFDQIDKFAGYGFNKSHSAAYALIAYQTAYLKANHPVAFMAALLSSEMQNTDKVASCIADCRELQIAVLPPDVNTSEVDFSVHGQQIRFGLNAVKNVGRSAATALLSARRKQPGERFASLEALLGCLDTHKVNRRSLETLIQCGALDSLYPCRKSMLESVDELNQLAQQHQKAQVEGQENLLGLLGSEAERSAGALALELPPMQDYTLKERLRMEKQAIGVFVSGHPLDFYESELRQLSATSRALREGEVPADQPVLAAGVISSVTLRLNRSAERFAVLQLEDLHGTFEVVVFAKLYREQAELLQEDEALLVRGRINTREQGVSVQAESLISLSARRTQQARRMRITPAAPLAEDTLRRLNGILAGSSGTCEVVLALRSEQGFAVDVQLPASIQPSPQLCEALVQCLPKAHLAFQYAEGLSAAQPARRQAYPSPPPAPPGRPALPPQEAPPAAEAIA